MTKRYFGTDGVRGIANSELTCKMAFTLGAAAVELLGPRLVIGKDTRRSGDMLEAAMIAGILAHGGTVISASHNAPEYNGIKFFDAQGYKLTKALEDAFEEKLQSALPLEGRLQALPKSATFGLRPQEAAAPTTSQSLTPQAQELAAGVNRLGRLDSASGAQNAGGTVLPTGKGVGRVQTIPDAAERYIQHAVNSVTSQGLDLQGLTVALDVGNGASFITTPEALHRLGAKVVSINVGGNGDVINVDSGSTNLAPLQELVANTGANLGIAHDGDADRTIAVDANGAEIDGDFIEAICALDLKNRGALPQQTVVSTVMCNLGFTHGMQAAGIQVIQTPVGDANVLDAMRSGNYILGGEQSGHMIFLEHNTTGDGLITALQLMAAMQRNKKSLAELAAAAMQKYPQELINVKVAEKNKLDSNQAIAAAIQAAESELEANGGGRILVRASGTEPLVRVMVEAATESEALNHAQKLANLVALELGQ